MVKVINIEMTGNTWDKLYLNGDEKIVYWENLVLNKFLNDGWFIKDWKMTEHDIIFILEKENNIDDNN